MTTTGSVILQLLGSLSLVETVVEFVYVIRYADVFTPFEKRFFFAAGISEMMGELLLILLMIIWLGVKQREALSAGGEGEDMNGNTGLSVDEAHAHLSRLSQDPIHVLKDVVTEHFESLDDEIKEADTQINSTGVDDKSKDCVEVLRVVVLVMISLVVTFAPTLLWWFVLIMLRVEYDFESDGDESIMIALTVISFICFFAVATFSFFVATHRRYVPFLTTETDDYLSLGGSFDYKILKSTLSCVVIGGALIYSVEKLFEIYLLMTRSDRLDVGYLGWTLVLFQMAELLSVANIVYYFLLGHFFGGSNKKSPKDQLTRIENAIAELQSSYSALVPSGDRRG